MTVPSRHGVAMSPTQPQLTALEGVALEEFHSFATSCAPHAADRATEVVSHARPVLLGFSGWPAAGKDTVPEVLFSQLGVEAEHVYFSIPLKREVDRVITLCRDHVDEDGAGREVAVEMGVSDDHGHWAARIIHAAAHADGGLHSRTRTPEVRELLQVWGTDVRRGEDPDYWVRQALAPAVETIAAGRCAYLSDVRFPNEVDGARRLGFHVTRLVVSRETVVRRLFERDGLEYESSQLDAMLAHPAESSLDGYHGFDLVLDNEGVVEGAVAAVRADVGL